MCVGLGVVQCVWAVFDFIGCLCGELLFVMSRRSQTARHDGGISAAFEKVARLRVHLAGNSPTPARPATCLDSGERAIG